MCMYFVTAVRIEDISNVNLLPVLFGPSKKTDPPSELAGHPPPIK